MQLKEIILNTFAHKKSEKIVFSPRIYYWYIVNKLYRKFHLNNFPNKIPQKYLNKTQLEIYDILKASPRYCFETIYLNLLESKLKSDSNVTIKRKRGQKRDEIMQIYKTPLGKLKKVSAIGGGLGEHLIEYPIKTVDDFKIMKYILDNTQLSFSDKNYKKGEDLFGDRGVLSTYLWHSPYQKLVTEYLGFSQTILFLKRYKRQTEEFMIFLEQWDNKMYELFARSPLKIINFGENIDANLSPPPYFETYLIPYYKKRLNQLRKAGKFCHIHIDGSLRDLLPYLSELPFDGYEALTAQPQGDVSIEEIKNAIEDKILLDGIPSILFLPEYSISYVEEYTNKVLELFSPNLILGISDELSPNGDIKKVEIISKIVENFNPT
ncbi:MAG: hypothetical protein ACFE85_19275 [Candidatus Hodarchaeota archaeon]